MKVMAATAVAFALMSSSFIAEARRAEMTEVLFLVNGALVGSVTYGCEGGQYFEWEDGVARTKNESRAYAATFHEVSATKMKCPNYTPPVWHCAKAFQAPETWEDAIISCSWYRIE